MHLRRRQRKASGVARRAGGRLARLRPDLIRAPEEWQPMKSEPPTPARAPDNQFRKM